MGDFTKHELMLGPDPATLKDVARALVTNRIPDNLVPTAFHALCEMIGNAYAKWASRHGEVPSALYLGRHQEQLFNRAIDSGLLGPMVPIMVRHQGSMRSEYKGMQIFIVDALDHIDVGTIYEP